jgi:hypothetical protein
MTGKASKLRILLPFLFTLYPFLFVYSQNMEEVYFSDIYLPLLFTVPAVLMTAGLFWLYFRDIEKTALITSLFLLFFFFYGYVYAGLHDKQIGSYVYGNHKNLMTFSALIFVFAFYKIRRAGQETVVKLNKIFSVIVPILLFAALLNITLSKLNSQGKEDNFSAAKQINISPVGTTSKSLPDIYYIILDGYANQTTLEEIYQFDNSDFVSYLTEKGFYVASRSRSNYSMTPLSISSSLNMNYYTSLVERIDTSLILDFTLPISLIKHNEVARFLKAKGYEFVVVNSGWGPTSKNMEADAMYGTTMVNEFTLHMIRSTMLVKFDQKLGRDMRRSRVLNMFSELGEVATDGKLKFVFAHFLLPHFPYMFMADGGPTSWNDVELEGYHWKNHDAYVEQLRFTNTMVKRAIDEIISKSKNPPVIILQSDHGPAHTYLGHPLGGGWDNPTRTNVQERMRNFNAYYFPDKAYNILYDSITPVNSFRKIFNHFFNTSLVLLNDESFFSDHKYPYKLTNVTDSARFDK